MPPLAVSLGASFVATMLVALMAHPADASGPDHAGDVEHVVQLTNVERLGAGLSPLTLSAPLSAAAQNYSRVLAAGTCFEHVCGAVPYFGERLRQAGYSGWCAIGENIAAGYPTAEAVVAGWMASSGHRANILSPAFTEIGVGVIGGGRYSTYWTEEFGSCAGTADDTP